MGRDCQEYTFRRGAHRALAFGIAGFICLTTGFPEQGDVNPWFAGTGVTLCIVTALVYRAATVRVSSAGLEHRRLYGRRVCYPWDTIAEVGATRAVMGVTGRFWSTITVNTNAARRVERGLTGTATTGETLGEIDAVVEWLNRARRHFARGSVEPIPDPPPRKHQAKATNEPRDATTVQLDKRQKRLRRWALVLAVLDALVLLAVMLTAFASIDTLVRPDEYPGNSEVSTYLGLAADLVGAAVLTCALVAVRGRLHRMSSDDTHVGTGLLHDSVTG